MQFSLTPFPQDPNAGTLLTGTTAPGGASPLEAPQQPPAGPFSQVLAGVDGAPGSTSAASQPGGVVPNAGFSVLAPAPMAYRAGAYAGVVGDAQSWQAASLQTAVSDDAGDSAEPESADTDAGDSTEESGEGEGTPSADLGAIAVQMLPGMPVTTPPDVKVAPTGSSLAGSPQPGCSAMGGGFSGRSAFSTGSGNTARAVALPEDAASGQPAASVDPESENDGTEPAIAAQGATRFPLPDARAGATRAAAGVSDSALRVAASRQAATIERGSVNVGTEPAKPDVPGFAAVPSGDAEGNPTAPALPTQRDGTQTLLAQSAAASVSEASRPTASKVADSSDAADLRLEAISKRAGAAKEKSAGPESKKAVRANGGIEGAVRNSLAATNESFASSKAPVGIGAADTDSTMSAGSTNARPNASETAAVSGALHSAEVRPDPLPQQVSLTSSAHRAVEAVLDVTDRLAARERHSVDLQFTVGDADLKVRVEMKAGEVHTTFRTDSAELRAALSSEWQSVSSQNSDRSTRLAAPVFASNDQGSSFSGDGAPRQRDQQSREPAPAFFPTGAETTRTVAAASSVSTGVVAASRGSSAKSLHLHTLA